MGRVRGWGGGCGDFPFFSTERVSFLLHRASFPKLYRAPPISNCRQTRHQFRPPIFPHGRPVSTAGGFDTVEAKIKLNKNKEDFQKTSLCRSGCLRSPNKGNSFFVTMKSSPTLNIQIDDFDQLVFLFVFFLLNNFGYFILFMVAHF